MPTLSGIAVHVLCDGSPLEEYATSVDPENPSVVSCWIASTADKEFSIQYEFETEESCGLSMSCILKCDGLYMAVLKRLLRRAGHAKKPGIKRHTQGKAFSGDKVHPITFSEMVETDSQEGDDHGKTSLGLIKIEVSRLKPDWEIVNQPDAHKMITIDESPIHENKKMLGGHRIKLGEPKVNLNTTMARPVYLDKTPYRTFKFYYRPLSLLRALGHAPVVTSTRVTAVKRSASVLSDSDSDSSPKSGAESEPDSEDERIAKLKREINARQEELAKITQKDESKPSKHGSRKAKRVKREESLITVPPSVMEGVIDLCSD